MTGALIFLLFVGLIKLYVSICNGLGRGASFIARDFKERWDTTREVNQIIARKKAEEQSHKDEQSGK